MNNQNYEVYKNIMSTNPIIDYDYFDSILRLQKNQIIRYIEVTEVLESNTALVIKVCVQIIDNDALFNKKLFIKTTKHDKSDNAYQRMSMREGKFYQLIRENSINNLPIPICYDVFVSDENGEFVIVLEDISNQYTVPDRTLLTDKNIWFSCAESLARFHSVFWNHNVLSKTQDKAEHDAQADRECEVQPA